MDFLIDLARNLENINLNLVLGIAIFFVFLVLIMLKGTILQTGIRILTKKKIGFYYMIIPTSLSILTNMILLGISYVIIVKKNIDIIDIVFQYVFNSLKDYHDLIYIIIVVIISQVIFIILQAFILKLINFDIYRAISKLLNKIFKKDKNRQNEELKSVEVDEQEPAKEKLSYINGILSGLFCFAIMFFLTVILIYAGEFIGSKYMSKL